MERHASETYQLPGEGLLTVSAGGRDTPPFRFSRMGPKGPQLDDQTIALLAGAMAEGGGEGSRIPAGFTYLGQFIAHDLSFDDTRVMFGANITPARLIQGRSPRLDLDSLYGAGPQDPESIGFYKADGVRLRTGTTVAADDIPAMRGFDLPRGAGRTRRERRKAVIADERNDDNLAIAQTHLAFIRFHNRVVDRLEGTVPWSQLFARARKLVTKHYQWMIRTDYLPRICAAVVLDDVFDNGRKAFEVAAKATSAPTMPIEFSVGTFRLGHSMIRRSYSWNARRDDHSLTLAALFRNSAKAGNLGGSDRLRSTLIADFRRMYDFRDSARPDFALPDKLNFAMRIDTRLVNPLEELPSGTFGETDVPRHARRSNLAFRNLTRAKMVELATGQDIARFLKRRGVTLDRLEEEQILEGDRNGAKLAGFDGERARLLAKRTPLWFYVLREAELNGGVLNGVGARIVAETFHRAMQGSRASIVNDAPWHPTLGPDEETFRMVDLLVFAYGGDLALTQLEQP